MTDSIVLFSDLHVTDRSVDTCLKVLEEVHEYASMRNAAVGFLGDFWTTRGSLPVRALNKVVELIDSFEVPMTMIPGNHDQVTVDGLEHGLQIFDGLAQGNVTVISEPKRDTVNHQLLWVPYRRDHDDVIEATKKHAKDLRAVFCHIDTVGGLMNNFVVAKQGLKPSDFASTLVVYTGHYHRPHSLNEDGSTNEAANLGKIRYIGSSYQVSASEAHQEKWLWLVSLDSFDIEESRQIDVGRRYWRLQGTDSRPVHLRKGDRVTYLSKPDEHELDELDDMGVEWNVLAEKKEASTSRIENAEELGPEVLWAKFASSSNMPEAAKTLGDSVIKDVKHEHHV